MFCSAKIRKNLVLRGFSANFPSRSGYFPGGTVRFRGCHARRCWLFGVLLLHPGSLSSLPSSETSICIVLINIMYRRHFDRKFKFFEKKEVQKFADSEKVATFASAFEK